MGPPGSVGVVTGANKGIGLEISAGFAANGLAVVAAARSEPSAAGRLSRRSGPGFSGDEGRCFLFAAGRGQRRVSVRVCQELRGVAPAGGK